MEWFVFFILSATCLLVSVAFAFIRSKARHKSKRLFSPSKMLFIGVILSSVFLFIPVYMNSLKIYKCGIFETILISIHNMIRLFIVDGEFSFVTSNLDSVPAVMHSGYTVLFSILFVTAPVLTFGFLLSFFKNISAYTRLLLHYHSDLYVFSELNQKSLSLAESLKKNKGKNCFFVFTVVRVREEEQLYELVEMTNELNAVCFKKDILTIEFSFHSKKSDLNFFTIGEDHSENIIQSLRIIDKYKSREHTNLYVFSAHVESEMLLATAFNSIAENKDKKAEPIKIQVRRINEIQSLISWNLYENGYEKIFKSAYHDENNINEVNAVIIGMGQYGIEMTKTLTWFCQMDGYLIGIDAFDLDPYADKKFTSICPELMKFSGKLDIDGESKYTIHIHSGVNVDTSTFDNIISTLPTRTTYVFVALGNDEQNISTAIKLRSLYERIGCAPVIQAVVYNSDKIEALTGIANFKGQKYHIDFIGDTKTSYSKEVILDSEVEEEALKRHLKWGNERDFWQYDYNYKSSIASAIHHKMKILCGIPGAEKSVQERTDDELWSLRILEHCRWNAYMRSEGYVYGGAVDKSGRNDLAKMHNCLVPFSELPLKEQIKDDY